MIDPIVIIGASHAGVQMAAAAREAGWDSGIILVGDEPVLPYQRPPLSKGLLTGKHRIADVPLRAEGWYEKNGIARLAGRRAVAIDRERQRVTLEDGEEIAYSRLGLATGARVRRLPLPGAELEGVLYIRALHDAEALGPPLRAASAVAVIGGGFIGLEVAASARELGRPVTVIEGLPRLMSRAVSPTISDWFARYHADHGIALRLSAKVDTIVGDGAGRAVSVRLADGGEIAADLVVVGIGVAPDTSLSEAAGLPCSDGVVVDEFCRTVDPAIVAAGDVAEHPSAFAGRRLRLESVQNANDQAKVAGRVMAGAPTLPYDAVPWFWSDQHDAKLQMVGLCAGADEEVVRGDPDTGRFAVFSFSHGRLVCIESVSSPRDHVAGRQLLAVRETAITPEEVADPDFDLLQALRMRRRV